MAKQNSLELKPRLKHRSLESNQRIFGYLFTLPFIVGMVLFVIFPIIQSLLYSFSDVEMAKEGTFAWLGQSMSNWGFQNYKEIWLEDVEFRKQVLGSLTDMATQVPVVVIFAFFIASVLNAKFVGRGFARAIMFLPVIISSGLLLSLAGGDIASDLLSSSDRFAANAGDSFQVTTAFQIMLENMDLNQGLVNFIVGAVSNINTIVTLSSVSIVIFMAGLQSISPSIYEASYIEGATKWEVFWKISLPMVSPLILLSVVYTIVDAFNGSNNEVIRNMHNQIIKMNYDTSSAMAVSYSLIILAILGLVFYLLNKVVFYQD